MPAEFPDVVVYLIEHEADMRRNLRDVLDSYGFGQIRTFATIEALEEALKEQTPDLIVCDSGMPDGDMNKLVRKVRHWQTGENPFIPVITTTWDSSAGTVKAIAASGADLLIGKPMKSQDLITRINAVVKKRRPFVVTSNYIGPDRRSDMDRPTNVKLIDVPNTLKMKVSGEEVTIEVSQDIKDAWREINDERVGRNAFHAGFLLNLIKQDLGTPQGIENVTTNAAALMNTCKDAARRLRGGKFEAIGDLFRRLYTSAEHVKDNAQSPDARQIQLMEQLVMALNRAVSLDQEDGMIARNINSAISKFQDRQ